MMLPNARVFSMPNQPNAIITHNTFRVFRGHRSAIFDLSSIFLYSYRVSSWSSLGFLKPSFSIINRVLAGVVEQMPAIRRLKDIPIKPLDHAKSEMR